MNGSFRLVCALSLLGLNTAHAADLQLDALLGGNVQGEANTSYLGISWIGDLTGGGPVPYAFTRQSQWDAQLPYDVRMVKPTPPPANVRIAQGQAEIAMGVVQILEDTHGDGRLDFTYDEINDPAGPVRAAVKEYWVLYVHNLDPAARAALELPFAGQLTEGFNIIQGSASGPQAGCPDHAAIVAANVSMTLRPRTDPSAVCWGGN